MKYFYIETTDKDQLRLHSIECDCGRDMDEGENEHIRGYDCPDFTVTHFVCAHCCVPARAGIWMNRRRAKEDDEVVILRECKSCGLLFPLIHPNKLYCKDCPVKQ